MSTHDEDGLVLDDDELAEEEEELVRRQPHENLPDAKAVMADIFGGSDSEHEESEEGDGSEDELDEQFEDVGGEDEDFEMLDQIVKKKKEKKRRKRKRQDESDDEDRESTAKKKRRSRKKQRQDTGRTQRASATNEYYGEGARKYENELKKAMASNRSRKKSSAQERDLLAEKAIHLLIRMARAADDDRAALDAGRPAIHKLKLLSEVVLSAKNPDLQELLLERGLLAAFKEWLEPTADGHLPSMELRTELLILLVEKIPPPTIEDLKHSGIGKSVALIAKHPQESLENRRRAETLINRWAGLVFGKQDSYKAMIQSMKQVRAKSQTGIAKTRSSDKARLLGSSRGEEEAQDDLISPRRRFHARIPSRVDFDFTARPVAQVQPRERQVNGVHMKIKNRLQALGNNSKGKRLIKVNPTRVNPT